MKKGMACLLAVLLCVMLAGCGEGKKAYTVPHDTKLQLDSKQAYLIEQDALEAREVLDPENETVWYVKNQMVKIAGVSFDACQYSFENDQIATIMYYHYVAEEKTFESLKKHFTSVYGAPNTVDEYGYSTQRVYWEAEAGGSPVFEIGLMLTGSNTIELSVECVSS